MFVNPAAANKLIEHIRFLIYYTITNPAFSLTMGFRGIVLRVLETYLTDGEKVVKM